MSEHRMAVLEHGSSLDGATALRQVGARLAPSRQALRPASDALECACLDPAEFCPCDHAND